MLTGVYSENNLQSQLDMNSDARFTHILRMLEVMSEELEWELYDIFVSGIFAFPIYEHNSARRIVRYLLMRGVLDEEIANAIEGQTVDLRIWLNRGGKHMVGEWVIAWLNESRDQYKHDKRQDLAMRRQRQSLVRHRGSDSVVDSFFDREYSPDSDGSTISSISTDDDDYSMDERRWKLEQDEDDDLDRSSVTADETSGASGCGGGGGKSSSKLRANGMTAFDNPAIYARFKTIRPHILDITDPNTSQLIADGSISGDHVPDSGNVSDLQCACPADLESPDGQLPCADAPFLLDTPETDATREMEELPVYCDDCNCTLRHYARKSIDGRTCDRVCRHVEPSVVFGDRTETDEDQLLLWKSSWSLHYEGGKPGGVISPADALMQINTGTSMQDES